MRLSTRALRWTVRVSPKHLHSRWPTITTPKRRRGQISHSRRADAQPEERRPDAAAPVADRDDRASAGRASRRWPSTRSTPKGSAATSSRCRPTPASSSSGWKSPTSIRSKASARRSRSGRRTASAIRDRRSARRPRFTTICGCSMPASGRRICRNCGREVIRETAEVVARRLGELPGGHAAAASASTCRSSRLRR